MKNHYLDVALITLLDGDLVQFPEHLGVAYLAAEVRNAGWTVEIFPTSPDNEAEVIARIASLQPRIAGFSLTTASFLRASRIGQHLRELLGDSIHITAGGPVVSSMGTSLLRNPAWAFLDSAVRGEGEASIKQLLEAVIGNGDFTAVPNLCYRTPTEVACNPRSGAVHDLDRLPFASRDQVLIGPFRSARIATSRGCTSRCSFCNAPHAGNTFTGKVWRGRSPESVVDEIESIYREHRVRDFEFVDSTFEDPGGTPKAKERIATIARLILQRNLKITFGCCVQAQNWKIDDLWLIRLLKQAGLQRVLIGVESGSTETLRSWFKKATVADNHRAVELFRTNGVYVNMGFIMFHPHSTRQNVMENAAFLKAAGCHNLRLLCTRMEVYPGTELLERLRSQGLLRSDYDATLNPYAYTFVDAEMEKLAYAMALLAGEEYARFGTVDVVPPHLQFAFMDFVIHRNLEWQSKQGPEAARRAQQFGACYRELCSEISEFNLGVFHNISRRIFAGGRPEDIAAETAGGVADWYGEKIAEINGLYQECMEEQPPYIPPLNICDSFNSMVGA
jgi:anaerobic magnesium-protoporphyrin IX monomethyl ester cyclase